jgi:CRP-like cAMP-binding protein
MNQLAAPSTVYELAKTDLAPILEARPQIAQELSRALAQRQARGNIADALQRLGQRRIKSLHSTALARPAKRLPNGDQPRKRLSHPADSQRCRESAAAELTGRDPPGSVIRPMCLWPGVRPLRFHFLVNARL